MGNNVTLLLHNFLRLSIHWITRYNLKMNYFAYGSNMSLPRIQDRIPGAEKIGVAVLTGHQLRFHKTGQDGSAKCDAFFTGKPDDSVWGVVFRITEEEKVVLDGYEGLGYGYEIKSVSVNFRDDTGTADAFLYYATHIDPALKPYHWYKAFVLAGAIENQFPESAIQAIQAVESQ